MVDVICGSSGNFLCNADTSLHCVCVCVSKIKKCAKENLI